MFAAALLANVSAYKAMQKSAFPRVPLVIPMLAADNAAKAAAFAFSSRCPLMRQYRRHGIASKLP